MKENKKLADAASNNNEIYSPSNASITSQSPMTSPSTVNTPAYNENIDNVISPTINIGPYLDPENVCFDIRCNKYMISANGFESGYHEWTIHVLKCDNLRQEIGIVSYFDRYISIDDHVGVRNNREFGARAIYGNNKEINQFYYASMNKDNSSRCSKKLSSDSSWSEGDDIKICLDLNKGSITFMLNGKKVRKSISVQPNTTYYPFISYAGDCRYCVLDSMCKLY